MRRKARTAVVILAIAAILGLGWWQLRETRSHARTTDAGEVGLTLYAGDEGIPLPDVEGKTIAGDSLSLADLRGHVIVLNVWGSWCAPCRAEAPDLAKISKESAPRGVRFVGIDVRDNPAAGLAFERKFGITYPSFNDQNGLVLASFTGIVPVSAVPSTLVIDRDGIIRARNIGRIDASTLRGLIEDAEKLG
ncbi:TlpA family protein disulfide reductase [Nocardioides panzhihuensis]|uniref:Thiol-disulfide isomerase/thioredoxin n=1 Tax=Nocardioides panzhihuensis TaxID=860243 RepID=A0A7Z0IRR0_9ACTN|nr:TlpA disulfide reductase family protein [Nocardioides panzhihuensis]NYI77060.1 thiol-disulfide isomerase/thioredoxin [Nocardioides panzhihuensis]